MTLILAFVAAHLGAFATGFVGFALAVLAWFHGKSTGNAQAADNVKVAQTQTQVAQMDAADAKADAEQAKQETAAVKVAAQAQAEAQATPDDQLDAELAKLGALRKD